MIAVLAIAFFELAVIIGAIRTLANAGVWRNAFTAASANIMFHIFGFCIASAFQYILQYSIFLE
ncbi:MAG: hypothetical protein UY23_C0005G0035 [Candidatus Jorgensenbacteria bacterium GW2011_GWA1_48_11]|uniref:Uncharacterized protein n=1 Tax=Candidatus Jorgensenbacteria bacterium GW2011_GWA1_48_11 TaxID=1618660 RepID=A0A0G1UA09_9BACT|nr:MAG: hypothetical protein UY23_C0005G0035 [Candidatus Jorgensenbacteria bacterium GW2011_GWA1_48_11]KKW12330.1 MAG: hypothetical protein UY51_C0005G0572 [Candidatus Jorgensenbacteria bacterium GW2011_GWB1_49_9]